MRARKSLDHQILTGWAYVTAKRSPVPRVAAWIRRKNGRKSESSTELSSNAGFFG